MEALKASDVIIGYTVYVDLVKDTFSDKEFLTTPMKKEVDRCVLAFEEAMKGKVVSMICSGDAGVYGMAGLMYEVGVKYPEVELEIVPGVTAALGGAAVLGAPLIHDFCLISLSDLLTPWEKIEARLLGASPVSYTHLPLYSTIALVVLAAVIVLRKNATVKVLDVMVPIMAGLYLSLIHIYSKGFPAQRDQH